MGPDTCIGKSDEEWQSQAKELVFDHQDCILVVVDCHAV